jgi:hypothetical protein
MGKIEYDERWQAVAETTPHVFQLPRIAPQGEDGVGHLNYYDRERMLSFQWNGRVEQHVTVSHGGYGEPTLWTFGIVEAWNHMARVPYREANSFLDACLMFRQLCNAWIDMMEENFA